MDGEQAMIHILIIHGPNLNLLGEREPAMYGNTSFNELNLILEQKSQEFGVQEKIFQSNSEGTIIDFIHENRFWANGILINPGALTHYSYSLRDAISAVALPTIEVHLSDIHSREPFRGVSVIKDVCIDQIYGLGTESYFKGLKQLITHIERT